MPGEESLLLLTDLYQLTMLQGYWYEGMEERMPKSANSRPGAASRLRLRPRSWRRGGVGEGEPLLVPVMANGRRTAPRQTLHQTRERLDHQLERLPSSSSGSTRHRRAR